MVTSEKWLPDIIKKKTLPMNVSYLISVQLQTTINTVDRVTY